MKQHKCDICGREINKQIKSNGYIVCKKHYNQLKKYGKFLDNNQRDILDRNEYHIYGNTTYIDLYDNLGNIISKAIIDTEDLNKIKYTRWRLSKSGYIVSSLKFRGNNKYLSSIILSTDQFVDYINNNKLDNRKSNLRIITKSQDQFNFKGIKEKNNKYYAHMKINNKNIDLGMYLFKEEALWARWYAESILFKNNKDEPFILNNRKIAIKEYVDRKVQRL